MVLAERVRTIEDSEADSFASPPQPKSTPDKVYDEESSDPEQDDMVMQEADPHPSNISEMHGLHKTRHKRVVRSLDLQAISMHDWD